MGIVIAWDLFECVYWVLLILRACGTPCRCLMELANFAQEGGYGGCMPMATGGRRQNVTNLRPNLIEDDAEV